MNAVIVETGLPGSHTVASWVDDAIGPPTRARPGVEIWTAAEERLREPRYGEYPVARP